MLHKLDLDSHSEESDTNVRRPKRLFQRGWKNHPEGKSYCPGHPKSLVAECITPHILIVGWYRTLRGVQELQIVSPRAGLRLAPGIAVTSRSPPSSTLPCNHPGSCDGNKGCSCNEEAQWCRRGCGCDLKCEWINTQGILNSSTPHLMPLLSRHPSYPRLLMSVDERRSVSHGRLQVFPAPH